MKKTRKAVIAALAAATLTISALGLAACGGKDNKTDEPQGGGETFTVTFKVNGGQWAADDTADKTLTTGEDGKLTALPANPTKVDYTFGGWYVNAEGTGTAYTVSTVYTADTTLYAKWTENGGVDVPPDDTGDDETGDDETGDDEQPSEDVEISVTLADGTAIDLVDNTENMADEETALYEYTLDTATITLSEDDVITVLIGGEAPENFGMRPGSHGISVTNNTITVLADGEFTFVLRYYEDSSFWEVEMNDGEVDELNVGHYYLVGGATGWACVASRYIGETSGSIIINHVDGAGDYKIAKCADEDGTIDWESTSYGAGNVGFAGKGYIDTTKDNITFTQAGTYTITLSANGVITITSEDVEEGEIAHTANVTFSDGSSVVFVFNAPGSWGLSEEQLNSVAITIDGTKYELDAAGSIDIDLSDIAIDGSATIKISFTQGNEKFAQTTLADLNLEDGGIYDLSVGDWKQGDEFNFNCTDIG